MYYLEALPHDYPLVMASDAQYSPFHFAIEMETS